MGGLCPHEQLTRWLAAVARRLLAFLWHDLHRPIALVKMLARLATRVHVSVPLLPFCYVLPLAFALVTGNPRLVSSCN